MLAALRTDLDCFTDAEAYALMYSGCRMAAQSIEEHLGHLMPEGMKPLERDWKFLAIEPAMTRPVEAERLKRLLVVGRSSLFKGLRLAVRGPRSAGRAPQMLDDATAWRLRSVAGWLLQIVGGLVLAPLTAIAAWVQLHLFDPMFLKRGSVEAILGDQHQGPPTAGDQGQ